MRRPAVAFLALAAASLVGCSAIWGFQTTDLLGDASTPVDAMTGPDGTTPRDGSMPHDGSHRDGTTPGDAMADAGPPDAPAADTGVDAGCHPTTVKGKLVFITDTATTGLLAGTAGADVECQGIAEEAGIDGAVHTFKAWISDDGDSVTSRFTQPSVPYKLANGRTIANSWNDLTTNVVAPYAPINLTLTCSLPTALTSACYPGQRPVWTSTLSNGNPVTGAGNDCSEWDTNNAAYDGVTGNADEVDSGIIWSQGCTQTCDQLAYLYCFEQ